MRPARHQTFELPGGSVSTFSEISGTALAHMPGSKHRVRAYLVLRREWPTSEKDYVPYYTLRLICEGLQCDTRVNVIRERVVAGMEYARRHGTKSRAAIGRPKRVFDRNLEPIARVIIPL
jgi:hypothetical protein